MEQQNGSRLRRGRGALALVMVLLALATLTGCGSSESRSSAESPSAESSPSGGVSPAQTRAPDPAWEEEHLNRTLAELRAEGSETARNMLDTEGPKGRVLMDVSGRGDAEFTVERGFPEGAALRATLLCLDETPWTLRFSSPHGEIQGSDFYGPRCGADLIPHIGPSMSLTGYEPVTIIIGGMSPDASYRLVVTSV